MAGRKFRVSVEQLRMARKIAQRGAKSCADHVEKITNALEFANHEITPLWKYVSEAEKCFNEQKKSGGSKQRSNTTMYRLSKHIDQRKNKRK